MNNNQHYSLALISLQMQCLSQRTFYLSDLSVLNTIQLSEIRRKSKCLTEILNLVKIQQQRTTAQFGSMSSYTVYLSCGTMLFRHDLIMSLHLISLIYPANGISSIFIFRREHVVFC